MPAGRPSDYTPEIAAEICELIAEDWTMRQIGNRPEMPDERTIYRWLTKNEEFRQQYARARERQAERWEDEILEISDDSRNDWVDREVAPGIVRRVPDPETVNRSKLRADNRKWLMSKRLPKKYGDRVTNEHTGPNGEAINFVMNLHRGS